MIGVFDSGSGGLTVLRALAEALPERSFAYLGDHARAPYGERTSAEIHWLTRAAVEHLFGMGCRLVVIACNTVSSNSLRYLQQGWLKDSHPEKRVLGVLVPMVEALTGVDWMAEPDPGRSSVQARTVAVFATRVTVDSQAYVLEVAKRAPQVQVVQQACPALVGLIEAAAPREETARAVAGYVRDLEETMHGVPPDAAILGCTHYPLVADLFRQALPAGVSLLSQPDLVASSLTGYLRRHPDIDRPEPAPSIRFFTTGEPAPVSALASAFFGRAVAFERLP